jgi:hypothetical protein
VPTSCQPAAANEPRWDATIEDISKSGLCLRLRRRFEPRSGLAVELPGDGQEGYTVYVKVIHVRSDGDGFWYLGCRFMSELSEDELRRLVGLSDHGSQSSANARGTTHGRRPAGGETTTIDRLRLRIGIGAGKVVHCRIKRFHVKGAWPLPRGKAFNVRGVAANGSRLDHQFEVVQCSEKEEGWTLQVQPVDPAAAPPWLEAFGRPVSN